MMNQNQVINESFLQLDDIQDKALETENGLKGAKIFLGKIVSELEEWDVGEPLPCVYVEQIKSELFLLLRSMQGDVSLLEESREEIDKLTSMIQCHQEDNQ